jgi:ferrous iron transport protein B
MKKIYLIGNPNVGKTSLFNVLTGSNEKTGNFAGTTFENKKGKVFSPEKEAFEIIDLAGMYTEEGKKMEEKSAWKSLEKAMQEEEVFFVQVINPEQWKHSLSLTLELQRKGIQPILLFNTKKNNRKLPENFYSTAGDVFQSGILIGDIEEKNYKEYFWERISEEQKEKRKLPLRSFVSEQEKFAFLEENFAHIFPKNSDLAPSQFFKKLDRIFLNAFFGVVFFFALMWVIFEATFTIGAIPMDMIDAGIAWSMEALRGMLGEGFFATLFIDGAIAGVGATVIFLPIILMLFFFLAILKETGYLARVSYLFDTVFKRIGTTGKASVHLLMGFGCNVPSVMAVKSLDTRKEKIIVSMMTLFMSCGARLPVYTLLIGAFIPKGYQGLTLWSLYIFGIFVALATGATLNRFYKKNLRPKNLLVEMPKLAVPSLKKILLFSLQQGKIFLFRVGKFVVPAAMFLWIIFSFPSDRVAEQGIEGSYGANASKIIQPIFEPIGFDWKITAGLISSIAAKEVMVATFAQLYEVPDEEDEEGIAIVLQESGSFSLGVALSLLFFTLLYTPCMAVLGVLKEELGWKWMLFGAIYPTIIAWIVGFILFRVF